MNDFWKDNGLDGSQSNPKALGHPRRPRQTQPLGVQQVPFIFIKNWHGACLYMYYFSKVNRSQCDTGWQRCSPTPSATSTSSSSSTASASYVHKMAHVFIIIFKEKSLKQRHTEGGGRRSFLDILFKQEYIFLNSRPLSLAPPPLATFSVRPW